MAIRKWLSIKTCYCHHVEQEVDLEADIVLPATWLPEQKPRILAHRCSHALQCNLDNRSSCIWSGTNPVIDPFLENF